MIKVKGIVEWINISHTKIWCRRSNGNGEGINQKIGMVECSTTYHQMDFSVSFKFLVDQISCASFIQCSVAFVVCAFNFGNNFQYIDLIKYIMIHYNLLEWRVFCKYICMCVAGRFTFFVFHLRRRCISFSISNHHHWIPFIVVIVVV